MAEWKESVSEQTDLFDSKPLYANKPRKVETYRHALMEDGLIQKCTVHGHQKLFSCTDSGYATLECGADGNVRDNLGFGHFV